jgi:hypothetical protein
VDWAAALPSSRVLVKCNATLGGGARSAYPPCAPSAGRSRGGPRRRPGSGGAGDAPARADKLRPDGAAHQHRPLDA